MTDTSYGRAGATDIGHVRGVEALRAYAGFYRDPIRCMERLHRRFGKAIAVSPPHPGSGRRPSALILVGPAFNKEVLMNADDFRPSGIWPVTGREGSAVQNLRQNALRLRGAEHSAYMRLFRPHVKHSYVDQLFEQVKRIAVSEVERWPRREVVDVLALCRRLAQHYSFSLLFGERKLERIYEFGRLVDQFHAANWSRLALFCRVDLPGLPYRRVTNCAEALQSFVLEWAEEQRGCCPESNVRASVVNASHADGRPLTPGQIAGNLSGFAMASYETSSGTLAWALFLLALHPRILNDLVDELSALPPIESLDLATLSAQPLLDAVINETMRLITPVPFLGFRTVHGCEVAGCRLDEGARLFVSPHMTHRTPELYDAPERFRPKRWFTINPTAFEYLPFSGGPRRCPGYWFAINNLKTALAIIVPHLRLSVAPNARIDRAYAATTYPKAGIPMKIVPQDRAFARSNCHGTIFDLLQVDD